MRKINFLYTSISFWDKASLGMPDRIYLNLHDQSITLIDTKVHVQNQLYTFFSFWDLKVLIASWAWLGMADPTLLKLSHKFVALIDMYIHAKN